MKQKSVIQITTESYEEEQHILSKFPEAVWISLKPGKTLFHLPFSQYNEVVTTIDEWEKQNDK